MNYIITRTNRPNELYHYGVPGMKWGHRKSSYNNAGAVIKRLTDPTTQIKKDGYKKTKSPIGTTISKDGYHTTKLPGSVRSIASQRKSAKADYKKQKASYTSTGNTNASNKSSNSNEKTSKKGLSAKQKKALKVGAAAVGTTLAVYGTYKLAKSGKLNSVADKGKAYVNGIANKKSAKKAAQNEYINRNIKNIQSHVDPGTKITRSKDWNHAYNQTLKSRQGSIKGDRALYGNKAVKNRNARRETNKYMYDSLRKDYDYWLDRVNNK